MTTAQLPSLPLLDHRDEASTLLQFDPVPFLEGALRPTIQTKDYFASLFILSQSPSSPPIIPTKWISTNSVSPPYQACGVETPVEVPR